ncbi:hypothetical protein P5673_012088 [Acropora cervicornis]|uniref:Uncharacterized protein n=1 Tax=Acropora cervicornis TaxID=6130 RepID=A0AAD9V814_ACRCE|nr:hypothetical protein P5673_012088 [Acropora cervicornis]
MAQCYKRKVRLSFDSDITSPEGKKICESPRSDPNIITVSEEGEDDQVLEALNVTERIASQLEMICQTLASVENRLQRLEGKHEGGGEGLTIEDSSEDGSGSIFPPSWTEWTPWSSCTESCGDSSLRLRSRRCLRNYPAECPGDSIQLEQCFLQPC